MLAEKDDPQHKQRDIQRPLRKCRLRMKPGFGKYGQSRNPAGCNLVRQEKQIKSKRGNQRPDQDEHNIYGMAQRPVQRDQRGLVA